MKKKKKSEERRKNYNFYKLKNWKKKSKRK